MKTEKSSNVVTVCGVRFDLGAQAGTFGRSHNEVRHCSRCELPLTDPASWERGVGPICAKKDTLLYTKTIPVNFTIATLMAMGIKVENLPEEGRKVWTRMVDVLLTKAQDAGHTNANFMAAVGQDVRSVAKIIDWMLSFRMDRATKSALILLVKSLGFVGLASVLAGNASTGDTKVSFENGRCCLRGSSNKPGWAAFRQVQGATYPRRRGSSEPFTVPATFVNRFAEIASEFWPCFEDAQLDEVRLQAAAWLAAQLPAPKPEVAVQAYVGPVATLAKRSDDYSLRFDWVNGKTPEIVAAIKVQIPSGLRSYDPATRMWFFRNEVVAKVKGILEGVYKVVEVATTDRTPPSQYQRSSYYNGRR